MKKIPLKNFDGVIVSFITVALLNFFDFNIIKAIYELIFLIIIWYLVIEKVFEEVFYFKLHKIYKNTFYFLFIFGVFITYISIKRFDLTLSPFLISSLLLTLLTSYIVGFSAGILQSILIAFHINDFYSAIYMISQILLMNYLIRNINRRIEIAKSAVFTSLLSFALLLDQIPLKPLYLNIYDISYGVLNPFISTIIILGTLPYIEYFTRIYSNIGLSELANMNHPLLKRLSLQAPGTYYHSIMVATLAEAAAERIGANSTFARVASYFHDIGKMIRPYFFVENIPDNQENPHDSISPFLSHLILEDHVKSGIELARKYRLPLTIEFIIPQHHGTRVQKYFYHKAKELEENVSEDSFRYPGPKPQFKEAGIIMLADSVEAALKSLNSSNYQRIKDLVENIVSSIYNERQLDESGLNLKELELIIDEFIKVIVNITKARIEYPKEEIKKVVQANGDNKQTN
ncbi:metal dependent phosphohydrolase [Thermosipho africanus H17ap60334]|uniref:Metal dependent phosphohydrolase n=1 Tax=Thermosipho africanus (strain TCF52B) TaxID=484019 RepID=B7ICX8_THEAB|nr:MULTISPECIES: HDIG domain-containing metalloprotein [Thermosipho]HCF38210.1 HDIG domain-containing protein [Thermosipho africanus]ACJ75855.1 metal dependent phosphohydrolase [Thermosipho africanus TCF52B]EKF49865.1 metal dependent phosphohydrolase [Thermosipho africanus H17ap60334]MBZ4650353.1 metal dependent phosphohydrolase [Thermosipho sp. (in: thermotogales)]MDK2899676.1 cyclic-di-AMP phosphodiesterase PgpH [Thermosipho sp. (in: thermotogales)]